VILDGLISQEVFIYQKRTHDG